MSPYGASVQHCTVPKSNASEGEYLHGAVFNGKCHAIKSEAHRAIVWLKHFYLCCVKIWPEE